MKKRPFLVAACAVGGVFVFFLLVILAAGMLRQGSFHVPAGARIGIIKVRGTITDSELLLQQIDQFRKQKTVKAVILRVDSPGGGVGPSQEIYEELKRLAAEKPLVVSMGSVAASGGYYIAVAAQRIFANPGTITGSIGVIMSFPDYQELMGKVGVKTEVVKSGRFKDIGSSTRDFTVEDRALLQGLIDDVHLQFIEAVSAGRKLPVEQLLPLVDGRIFTGRQALEEGLIDELGSLPDAVRYTAQLIGAGDDPELLYPDEQPTGLWERYLNSAVTRLGFDLKLNSPVGPQFIWSR